VSRIARRRTTCLFGLVAISVACHTSSGRSKEPVPKTYFHHTNGDLVGLLSSTVVFIYSEGGVALGTASVVGYPVTQDGQKMIPLIVTAKHVINGQQKIVVKFKAKQIAKAKTVSVLYDLESLRVNGDLWEHDDPTVDLIVFRTTVPDEAEFQAIPRSLIASRKIYETADIKETDRVVFPSMLVGLKNLSRDYPVVREGTIALIPEEPIPWQNGKSELVLINAAANQGSSGAPVFLWPGPRINHGAFTLGGTNPVLLGVIEGFFISIPREVSAIDTVSQEPVSLGLTTNSDPRHPIVLGFSEDSRIGCYTPAWLLGEILEQNKLSARMKVLGATN
jgi:hypothetical protein